MPEGLSIRPVGLEVGIYKQDERQLADLLLPRLQPGMLCLCDRNFFSFRFWEAACARGADLLWRIKSNAQFPVEKRLSDDPTSAAPCSRSGPHVRDMRGCRCGSLTIASRIRGG